MLLIKRTNAQELGYRNGVPDQAGKYLLISKRWVENFPILTTSQKNDSAPVALEVDGDRSAILPYVWHNDKLIDNFESGRNEYRLYLANALQANLFLLNPGDLVVFRASGSSPIGSIHDRFQIRVIPQGTEAFQKLLGFATEGCGNYWTAPSSESENLIDAERVNGQEGPLAVGQTQLSNQCESVGQVVVDQVGLANYLRQTPDEILSSRTTDQMFRDLVIAAYDRRCALSDVSIWAGGFTNLEAAHIQPSSHGGGNLPSNGLALSRDLHWAFDKGAFTFGKDGCVIVHPKVASSELGGLGGKRIRSPKDPFYAPRELFLDYHRAIVFGLFLRTGTLSRVS